MELNAGGVIAYISSSSSASSPASCHSEGSENSFQSSSSSVPSSPNSSNCDANGNPKNTDVSSIDGVLKSDRTDCPVKTGKPGAPGMTKSHSGMTRLLQEEHSAEHPVQEVPEERELLHHEDEQEPMPAVPLQEVSVCGNVAGRCSIWPDSQA